MAEASDHQADVHVTAQPPAGPDAAATLPPSAETEVYRPLSIVALIGVSLAVLYSLCVLLGGLVPFIRVHPIWFLALLVLGSVAAGLTALQVPIVLVLLGKQFPPVRRYPRWLAALLFAAAVLLVLLVVVGLISLVAYSASNPWQLPLVSWLLLGAALLVSWIAWARIRESEGALGGLALARWGVALSLGFGIFYGVYLLGNRAAVSSQAVASADEYLELIRDDDLPRAFLRTLKPGARPSEGGDLERALEVEFNTPRTLREPGMYSGFCLSEYVQFIRNSGQEARFKRLGSSWEFKEGHYEVEVVYNVETTIGEFILNLLVISVESTGGGTRQWYIQFQPGAGALQDMKQTQASTELFVAMGAAQPLAREWTTFLQEGQLEAAYLDTLPPKDRKRQGQAWVLTQPLIGAAAGFAPRGATLHSDDWADFLKGRADFTARRLVDDKDFIADEGVKRDIRTAVDRLFSGKAAGQVRLESSSNIRMPHFSREGDLLTLRFPVRVIVMVPGHFGPKYMAEAEVVVKGRASEDAEQGEFRVVALRLRRGMLAPSMLQAQTRP
jgi:hypothetical protein